MLAKALEPGFPIPLNVTDIKDFSLLDYWLERFIIEIRRKDSQPYPGNTLIQISSALQRHLRANSIFKDVNFFKTDDSTFAKMGKKMQSMFNYNIFENEEGLLKSVLRYLNFHKKILLPLIITASLRQF